MALREWVREEGALLTLEAGLGFGLSALFMLEGLLANGRAVRHVAADPYQFASLPHHRTTYLGVGLQVLEEAGVRDLVEFYPDESQIVLPRLLAEGRQFDLAFLDGNHRFEGVFLDLVYSARLLKEGGIVFADDTRLPGVHRGRRLLCGEPRLGCRGRGQGGLRARVDGAPHRSERPVPQRLRGARRLLAATGLDYAGAMIAAPDARLSAPR